MAMGEQNDKPYPKPETRDKSLLLSLKLEGV